MSRIDQLIEQIRGLEEETQIEFDKKRGDFKFVIEEKRAHFSAEIAALQRGAKTGLFRYMTGAPLLSWLVAPVIYSGIVPMVLFDLFLSIYQAICFPVYHIAKVKRSEYVILDRGDLPYLNALEKLNCGYCGYANGLMAYGREVSGRTEQFFCPIKHARTITAAHDNYSNFFEFGDAESYRMGLERLRAQLAEAERRG